LGLGLAIQKKELWPKMSQKTFLFFFFYCCFGEERSAEARILYFLVILIFFENTILSIKSKRNAFCSFSQKNSISLSKKFFLKKILKKCMIYKERRKYFVEKQFQKKETNLFYFFLRLLAICFLFYVF
jgi:hypothetical protein